MNKKSVRVILIILLILILVFSIIYLIYSHNRKDAKMVEILQNGTLIEKINLTASSDRSIRIDGENGNYNIIRIENGEIFMDEASCPDKVCINTGVLRSYNLPIVCLPNKVVVKFTEE